MIIFLFLFSIEETSDADSLGAPLRGVQIRDQGWVDLNFLNHEFDYNVECMYIMHVM